MLSCRRFVQRILQGKACENIMKGSKGILPLVSYNARKVNADMHRVVSRLEWIQFDMEGK